MVQKHKHETSILSRKSHRLTTPGRSSGMAEVRILPSLSRNRIKPKAGFYDATDDLQSGC
jgi:hypothetical protein